MRGILRDLSYNKLFWFKGGGHLFHVVVLASAPPSTNFKSIYSNQFKRYEYIQGIWEMQNFMKNTMEKALLRAPAEYSAF